MKHWDNMTEDERNNYINQDYVKQSELILPRGFCENREFDESWSISFEKMNSKTMKSLIIEMYNEGKNVKDIAYHLPCNTHWIFTVIKEMRESVSK